MTRHIRRLLALAAVALVSLLWLAGPALAQVAEDGNVSPDAPVSAYLTINNTLVLIVTGFLVPFVNGLLLRPTNPVWVKALLANLVATSAHAFSQVIQTDGTAFLSQEWFLGLGLTLAMMAASYLGFWQPIVKPNETVPTVVPLGDWLSPPSQIPSRT